MRRALQVKPSVEPTKRPTRESGMTDIIYRGTVPVAATETQMLLSGSYSAIWSPPMNQKVAVSVGDRVWLLWQGKAVADDPILLGVGVVMAAPDGEATWTSGRVPGIRKAAMDLGYRGPTNMRFLRLSKPTIVSPMRPVRALGKISTVVGIATPEQLKALRSALDE